jgi:hypothetical protein
MRNVNYSMMSLLVVLSVFLSACHSNEEQYYYTHPDKLKTMMKTCQGTSASMDSRCKSAYAAAKALQKNSHAFLSDQEGYGKSILALEMRIAKTKKQLAKTPSSAALKKTLAEQEQEQSRLLFIVSWYASPV